MRFSIEYQSQYFLNMRIKVPTNDIFNAALAFDNATVTSKTQAKLDAGTAIEMILNDGLISAIDEIGEKFSVGKLFVPEMLMAAQAMKAGLELCKPHLGEAAARARVRW